MAKELNVKSKIIFLNKIQYRENTSGYWPGQRQFCGYDPIAPQQN
jgi:hypothetical protein